MNFSTYINIYQGKNSEVDFSDRTPDDFLDDYFTSDRSEGPENDLVSSTRNKYVDLNLDTSEDRYKRNDVAVAFIDHILSLMERESRAKFNSLISIEDEEKEGGIFL